MFGLNVMWNSRNSAYTLFEQGEELEGWHVNPRYDVYISTKK